jgi:hypothetical protein
MWCGRDGARGSGDDRSDEWRFVQGQVQISDGTCSGGKGSRGVGMSGYGAGNPEGGVPY